MDIKAPPPGTPEGRKFMGVCVGIFALLLVGGLTDKHAPFSLTNGITLSMAVAFALLAAYGCLIAKQYENRAQAEAEEAADLEWAARVAPFFGGTNSAVNGDVNGGTVVMGRDIDVHGDTPSSSDDEAPDEDDEDDNPDSSDGR